MNRILRAEKIGALVTALNDASNLESFLATEMRAAKARGDDTRVYEARLALVQQAAAEIGRALRRLLESPTEEQEG